ncbi:MAG: methyltransferase domain-containing protein [Hyphomicrobiaceae bacterium]
MNLTKEADAITATFSTVPKIFDRRRVNLLRKRAAERGDVPDFLLAHVSGDFIERLSMINRDFNLVLNIGSGTGRLSAALIDADAVSPASTIVDLDITHHSGEHRIRASVVGDEEALPFRDGAFDLVVAGLTLQYVNDLPGVLTQIQRLLKPDGLFLGAIAAGETLHELRLSTLHAEAEVSGGASPRVAPFADVRELGGLLQRAGFALPVADSDSLIATYETPLHLMRELKAMGAGNALADRRKVPMTRSLLFRIIEEYTDHFSTPDERVTATFEIVTLTGWAPHASQQKPLQPGSASRRLADALGVPERESGESVSNSHNSDDK